LQVAGCRIQRTLNLELKPETWNLEPGTWNLKPETWNLGPGEILLLPSKILALMIYFAALWKNLLYRKEHVILAPL
jgi:hypothetical protein